MREMTIMRLNNTRWCTACRTCQTRLLPIKALEGQSVAPLATPSREKDQRGRREGPSDGKQIWVKARSKEVATAAIEAGISTFIFDSDNATMAAEFSALGRCENLFVKGNQVVTDDGSPRGEFCPLRTAEELRELQTRGEQGKVTDLTGSVSPGVPGRQKHSIFTALHVTSTLSLSLSPTLPLSLSTSPHPLPLAAPGVPGCHRGGQQRLVVCHTGRESHRGTAALPGGLLSDGSGEIARGEQVGEWMLPDGSGE